MEQLTIQDIYNLCEILKKRGYDLSTYPVFIGDDDELNGVHHAWYCETFKKGEDSYEEMIEVMQRGDIGNPEKGILIS